MKVSTSFSDSSPLIYLQYQVDITDILLTSQILHIDSFNRKKFFFSSVHQYYTSLINFYLLHTESLQNGTTLTSKWINTKWDFILAEPTLSHVIIVNTELQTIFFFNFKIRYHVYLILIILCWLSWCRFWLSIESVDVQ